jgi:hypothetical protein
MFSISSRPSCALPTLESRRTLLILARNAGWAAALLDDVPGALWNRALLEAARPPIGFVLPDLVRVVVAIDPAASSGEDSDETGIIVAGKDKQSRGYVLADLSGRYTPIEWARIAVAAYKAHGADRVVAEVNNGGEMVENTLRVDNLAYTAVHATRGKVVRAEPVSALYEPEVYEFSDQVFRLIKAGYIKAGSVGFSPLKFSFAEDSDRAFGIDFHEQELLEFSVVPVPANANALVQAAVKSLAVRGTALAERPEAQLGTMSFAGTGAQRAAQLAMTTRHARHARAAQALDLAIAFADSDTVEGRRRIVRAHRRYIELTSR